jgi:hypothetical protein
VKKFWTEARLILIGIPVAIWTLLPIYHLFLFSISTKDEAFSGQAVARSSDAQELRHGVPPGALLPQSLLGAARQLARHRDRRGLLTALRRDHRRVRDQPHQGARRPHGAEPRAVHVLHPRGVPGRAMYKAMGSYGC